MSLCNNCKTNPSKYECLICNCSFCLRCDSYIHSFPENRGHHRHYISVNARNKKEIPNIKLCKNKPNLLTYQISQQNNLSLCNNYPNLNLKGNLYPEESNLNKKSNTFIYNKKDCDKNNDLLNDNNNFDIVDLDEDIDHDLCLKKISSLSSDIIESKQNFDNKIEALHEHFHIIDENNKSRMSKLNNQNLKEIDAISAEKDTQIQQLKEILEEQTDIINHLCEEKKNLEKDFNKNKNEIEKLNSDKQKLIEENDENENMHIQKLKEVVQMNQEEKNKLIEDYDEEMTKLKNEYIKSMEKLEYTFQEKQNRLNDYLEDKNRERNDLNTMIDNLKNTNENKIKECNILRKNTEELEKIYNDRAKQYNAMKDILANSETSI